MPADKFVSNINNPEDEQSLDLQAGAPSTPQAPPQATPQVAKPQVAPPQVATPNANAQPQVKSNPIDQQQSLFRNVLESLGGGPTKTTITDPNTGETRVQITHQSKKGIGASILAGAISGMLAGVKAPNATDQFGHQDLSPSAQAGADAGAAVSQKRNQEAQDFEDKKLGMQYQIMKHNLDQHAAVMNNMKLQGEVMAKGVADAAPTIQGMLLAQRGSDRPIIKKQNVTEDELQKMMADGSAHVTRDSVMVDGVTDVYGADGKPVMNNDGTPKQAYTYTIYDPSAMIQMTDEIRKNNPELVNVPVGQNIPVRVLAKYATEKNAMNNAQGFMDDWSNKTAEANGDKKPTKIDLRTEIKKDPYMAQIVPILGKYAGRDPDQVLDEMEKDHVDPNLIGRFQKLFDIDRDKMAKKRAADERAQKSKEQVDEDRQKSAITLQREKDLALFKKQQGISDSAIVNAGHAYTNDWQDANGNHWDMTAPEIQMVEGNTDPTQLSKKSKDYDAKMKNANAYSFVRYGKAFDMAQAQIDFKEAQNPTVRSTLRYLNSLTGNDNQSGNLGALVTYSDKFERTTFKSVNEVKAWINQHRNDNAAVNYGTAVVEVADQVAKILQGGGSGNGTSDAKLKQAQELFDTGFSGSQIKDVAGTLRVLLANRKEEMVTGNRYLAKQFGQIKAEGPKAAAKTVPDGKVPAFKNGQVVGYADDKTGKNYVAF